MILYIYTVPLYYKDKAYRYYILSSYKIYVSLLHIIQVYVIYNALQYTVYHQDISVPCIYNKPMTYTALYNTAIC
jgi:hypothetical protein